MPHRVFVPASIHAQRDWWVKHEAYLPMLEQRDRLILVMRYGLRGGQIHTQEETGTQFGIRHGQVYKVCICARHRVEKLEEAKDSGEPLSLNSKVYGLDINERVYSILERAGIVTVGELVEHTQSSLRRIPRLGPGALAQIISALAQYGWKLRE